MNGAPDVHPQVMAVLEAARMPGMPPWYDMPVAEAPSTNVNVARAAAGTPITVGRVADDVVAGPETGVETRIRISYLGGEGLLPGVVFYHGGGLVLGNLDSRIEAAFAQQRY